MTSSETGQVTGTNGESDLAGFFRKAQADSRKGAEQGKQLLKSRLAG